MAEKKEVKLQFAKAVGMPAAFADQATLQSMGEIILLTFYQTEPPLLVEADSDIESVTAYPIARIALRPGVVKSIHDMIARTLETLEEPD